jgi:PAS domain S-box-containing protein
MAHALKILMLEDSETDAALIQRLLRKDNPSYNILLADDKKTFLQALEQFQPDLILADNSLPQFTASEALYIVNQQLLNIPFILVTGTVSEEFAATIIKEGADDYILKDRLTRLPVAIEMALRQRQAEKEKREAAERLKKSEEIYRTLVEQAFDGIIIYSPAGIILDCNHSACTSTGYTHKELQGLSITDLLLKEELARRPLVFETLKKGLPTLDYRKLKKKDGSVVEMEIGTKMMPDGNLMAVGRDITERKESQRKIIQSEENLKAIFDNASEAFILTDKEGIIKTFNDRARQSILLNVEKEITVGKSIFDFTDKSRKDFFKNLFARILQGETIQYDRPYVNKNGESTWFNFSYNPVKKDSVINGVCITGRDITETKLAEQQREFDQNNLNALINTTKDLMWSVDRDLKLITSNKAFDHIVKLISGTIPTKGSQILSYAYSKEQLARYKSYYERALAGETFTEIEHTNTPDDFWSEITFYPIHEGSAVIGTACFSRNITERKKAEDEIMRSNERYIAVSKATSDAIWDYDFALNKTYIAGTGYKDLFGYNLVNQYSEDLFWESRIHPADKKRVLEELEETLANKNISQSQCEYRFLKADGSYAYLSDRYFIIRNSKGKPIKMLGAKQDITLRKKAEEQLKKSFDEKRALAERMSTIINTLPANIALLNDKGVIVDVNDAWRRFTDGNGFIGSEYSIGDNYMNISQKSFGENQKDRKTVAKGVKDVLTNKVKEFVFEYSCHSPNMQRWFRMVATPLREKEYAGAVVMHIDISELRRLEQERLQSKLEEQKKIARAMLHAQEKERNQLGQELHDNISQLLAATKMKLSFAIKKEEKMLSGMQECIVHVQEAIIETRNLSHRMVIPRFAENSFQSALKELTEQYNNEQRSVKLLMSKEVDKIPVMLKETLYRIVQEQLNNIEKYAKASGVTIEFSTGKDHIDMTIQDNGVGFDTKKKAKGIGLMNILNRAESFNGSAIIISEPGKGCTLTVAVPLTET